MPWPNAIERKVNELEIARRSTMDDRTGLPNRRAFGVERCTPGRVGHLSAAQLLEPGLHDALAGAIANASVDPGAVCLG